jgi:hypothetical protein
VGDEYPLSFAGRTIIRALFIETYTGVGATEDQFIKTFAACGIKVVFRRDVDAK